ncbi:MAG: L,D-transpeptidase [Candidatus Saccharimonadales bacterium]
MKGIFKSLLVVLAALCAVVPVTPVQAAEASSSVSNAQRIMTKFGIPAGPVDGMSGPQTSRGLCIFRYISGLSVSRNNLDSTTYSKLKQYDSTYSSLSQIKAKGSSEYLVAHETCQAMVYARSGYYQRVMAISTGVSGHGTPNGSYSLGYTQKGWACSTLYPESCRNHTEGQFASVSRYGNMYNMRQVTGPIYVHGSTEVPTYPASHGCIRVTVSDSDWMYANVGNGARPLITITGAY